WGASTEPSRTGAAGACRVALSTPAAPVSLTHCRRRSARAHDLGGECLQRVPVVRPFTQGDAEPRAAERAELVRHRARVLHRPAEITRALGARTGAEVAAEDLVGARGAPGVGPEIKAEVHGAHDRRGIAPFRLAPPVEHLALVLPVVRAHVGAVPAVGVLRGRAQRALLAAPADPDGDAGLQRLGIVGGVEQSEVLAVEARAPLLGIE